MSSLVGSAVRLELCWAAMEAYQLYGAALLRKCERLLRSRQDAEDIVQGLFVDLLRSGKDDVDLPYLYRAVTNRCINHLRYGQNRQRLLREHDEALRGPMGPAADARLASMQLLLALMERLDSKSQEILVYRFLDEMHLAEIADLMKISRRAVTKRLTRIRLKLEELAKDDALEVGA